MIASLVWKEYREHRSIWIAMAVMAVGTLTIATQWKLPNGWKAGDQDAVATVVAGAFVLAGMYGLVCGAMMFAGERESRAMPYLDTSRTDRPSTNSGTVSAVRAAMRTACGAQAPRAWPPCTCAWPTPGRPRRCRP